MPLDLHTVPRDTHRTVSENFRKLQDHANELASHVEALKQQIAAQPRQLTLQQIRDGLSSTGAAPLDLTGLIGTPFVTSQSLTAAATGVVTPPPAGPLPPGVPPVPPSAVNISLTVAQPAGVPPAPNLRWFRGNLCGVRVAGLPAIPGGAPDPTLALSWLYFRYNPANRGQIRAAHLAHGYTHFQLSWPDARAAGVTVAQYVVFAQELAADGFFVGHFLSSKDFDPHDPVPILAGLPPVLAALQAANVIPWASVGWELSLWLTPTQVQTLIDGLVPTLVPTTNLYVHFQQDYIAFQQPGGVTADFWNLNVGKLTGLLHQRTIGMDNGLYQARIDDGLSRFAGNFGFVADSGFGHPFDYVTYEVTAAEQFAGTTTESQGDTIGKIGILAPAQSGPAGMVPVMGFGNGATAPL